MSVASDSDTPPPTSGSEASSLAQDVGESEFLERMENMRQQLQEARDAMVQLAVVIEEARKHLGGSFVASDGCMSYKVADGEAIRELFDEADAAEIVRAHDEYVWDDGAVAATYSVSATHHYAENPHRKEQQ